ncbi:prominin-like protein isoform X1 [Drosophila albomicans]|uniref:Prominin-like protein isoform X1 n=1 Tax=Drosophila albomicans TaxID=7291 RepID=A0A9C6SXM8_DROAB|nr:prominin-like protein isoform X1 [Drosophila albomicans]
MNSDLNYGWKLYFIAFLLLLGPAIVNSHQQPWRDHFVDHGTIHEMMGQSHWGKLDYTKFEGVPNYTKPRVYPSYGMKRVFNASHALLENILDHNPAIPAGYIAVKGDDTLALGQKVEFNDWYELVTEYALIFLWICLLLVIIILIPFIAVCYCCFCCCRRCNPGCAPCDYARDMQCMIILGLLLLLMIAVMICGGVIAAFSNRMMDRGLKESAETVRRGNEDVCIFLKHTKDHIHHLFSNNYQELINHISNILINAHNHISVDIVDTSGADALEELERILDNMPEALILMKEVTNLEKQIRFLGDQLRDGIRAIRRNINEAYLFVGYPYVYYKFLKNSLIQFVDTSKCLHFDEMPDTSVYVQGIEEIIANQYALIPKEAILRFQFISEAIKKNTDKIGPMILMDLGRGRDELLEHSVRIQNIIDAVISDLHINTWRTASSFEDIHDKTGKHRSIVNSIVCVMILLIAIVLFVGLISGFCFNRTNGVTCLLLGMILIFFCVSFIALVGLFHFVIGIITYHGGCAPFKDRDYNEIFRQLDALLDVSRYVPNLDPDQVTPPPLRVSNAIAACEAHQTIFQVLLENRIFDINQFQTMTILKTGTFDPVEDDSDFSKAVLLTTDEIEKLDQLSKGNLSTYRSDYYLENICKDFTPIILGGSSDDHSGYLASQIRLLCKDLLNTHTNAFRTRAALYTHARDLDKYQIAFVKPITAAYENLKIRLAKIDKLITYHALSFGVGITTLVNDVIQAQLFIRERGKEFISSILTNLTSHAHEEVEMYLDKLVFDCNSKIGLCEPLAYIYYRSVGEICGRLVDPINGFWFGVLPCAILMVPALYIAHRLICLFKKHPLYTGGGHFAEMGRSCPVCTGIAQVAQPIIPQFVGAPGLIERENAGDVLQLENSSIDETTTEEDMQRAISKRKRD